MVSTGKIIEWLKNDFENDADHTIEKDRFWHSYKSIHGSVEKDRDLFFSLLGNAFLLAGFSETISIVKRKRKSYGYKGLAFKLKSTPAPSAPSLDINHLKKWMLDNYLEGDEQDVVRKVDIWNHFEEENAVSADCKNQFFSYLGQYVFCAEPFRRVTVEIKKKKRHGYSFLRRMPIVTEIADAALSHRIIYNVDDMHSDVEEKKLDSTICATVSSTNQEPSSSAGTETHYPKRDCVTDHLVDQEASNEGPMELSDEEFTSDEHSDSLEDEELEDEEIECETVRKSEEPLSSTIDGLEDAAKRFYLKHYKSIKKLLPSQLPGSHKTFGGFLQEIFPNDVEVTGGPVEAAGKSTVYKISQMRAFLAVAFPPLVVGSLAIEHVQSAEKGKHFPQFSHVSGSTIKCEICLPHQKWATVNLKTCHKLKSKHVTVQSILDGTAILNFSGVVQAEEHNRSKCHQDALLFFTEEKQTMELKATFQEKKVKRVSKDITSYFKAPLN